MTSNQESEFNTSNEEELEIARFWQEFLDCDHKWVEEPKNSNFYYICSVCGGAKGLRMPEDWLK